MTEEIKKDHKEILEKGKEQVEEMLKDPKKKGVLKGIVDMIAKDAAELSEAFNKSDFAIKDFMKSKTAWIIIAIIGMGGFSGWYFANQDTIVKHIPSVPPIEQVQEEWKNDMEIKPPSTPENKIEEPKDIPQQELPQPPALDSEFLDEGMNDVVNQRAMWCKRVLRRFDSYWIDRVGGQVGDKVLEREARRCKKYLNKIGASYLYSK